MTNPFLTRPDGYGGGLPQDGPQAGILIHKHKLDDPTVLTLPQTQTLTLTLIHKHKLDDPTVLTLIQEGLTAIEV